MIFITRKEHFSAAHKLSIPDWSEEKNEEIFGKCANINWHGHNYTVYVTVKGEPNSETGFLENLKLISELIKNHVVEKMDHKNVNLDVDFMTDIMPTTENITIAIWKELQPHIDSLNCELHCVKLQETENNYAEYFGK